MYKTSTRRRRGSARAVQARRLATSRTTTSTTCEPAVLGQGLPYLDAINYKIIPDEQARIAALRAGAIDGATVSVRQRQLAQGPDRT